MTKRKPWLQKRVSLTNGSMISAIVLGEIAAYILIHFLKF